MQSDDFLRQIVMDGRADSLTFVGTAADDVDLETGVEEFGLPEDATLAQVVEARNRGVRRAVMDQLEDLSGPPCASTGEKGKEHATKLASRLQASKVFTISAREYMRMQGLANTIPLAFKMPTRLKSPR